MTKVNIFISYCHVDISLARKIETDLSVLDFEIIRDERTLAYTEDIESYMKIIRICDYVLFVVSGAFLKSTACMHEIDEFFKDDDHKEKILPVIVNDYFENGNLKEGANIYNTEGPITYLKYWEKQEDEIRKMLQGVDVSNLSHFANQLARIQKIQKIVSDFISLLKKIKHVSFNELIKSGYKDLLDKFGYFNVDILKIRKAKSLYNQAISEVTVEKRMQYLNKSLSINPYFVESLRKRGQLFDEIKEYDKALEDYNKAISIAPQQAALYINRSYSYIRLEKFSNALQDIEKAIELDPNHKEAYNNAADIYRRLGDLEKAIEFAEKTLDIDSEFDLAYATIAEIAATNGDKKNFYENLTRAVELGFPLHKYSFDEVYSAFSKDKEFQSLHSFSSKNNQRFV